MAYLAMCVALFCVFGICAIPFLPSFRKSDFVKPSSFTFSARAAIPAIVAEAPSSSSSSSSSSPSEIKTLAGYPAIEARTQKMPVLIMEDRQVGQEMPAVFVDVGIWCD